MWRDIETAPKDGTNVLLHHPGRPPIVAGFVDGYWESWDGDTWKGPTHWHPLPEPPVSA